MTTDTPTMDIALYGVTDSGVLERSVVTGWSGSLQDYMTYYGLTAKGRVALTGWPEAQALDCGRVLVAPLFAAKTYTIEAGDLIMGEYEGDSPEQALDAYARDAGYTDYRALVVHVGGSATATETIGADDSA